MIRLFVGLGLPPDVAERLAAQGFGLPGARWVPARNLHLTLRFMGELDEAEATELHEQLRLVSQASFTLSLAGIGVFGDRHRAHTLWQGVDKSEELIRLAARVELAAIKAGQKPEPRKFAPHITLARIKETAPARIQEFLAAAPPHRVETVPVEEFLLYRSTLGRHGPEYDVLECYPLG